MTALATHVREGVGLVERRTMSWIEPLPLDSGETLGPITLAYETYGQLNEARDNAILLHHALSGDAHAAGRHRPNDQYPGWWDEMVGPGRPFDTDRYFVICSNIIGGCQGSTGPSSIDPSTLGEEARPYGARFPVVTIGDMVRAQVRLIDALGIEQLHAVAGGSMGGFQALEWAISYPDRVRGVVLVASSARTSAQALAWNAIGRQSIMNDPNWRGGDYYGHETPQNGLAVARMIGHVTYLSEPLLERKFGRNFRGGDGPHFTLEQEFDIESYLNYKGQSFNNRFDANSYLYITKAMDYWDLPGRFGSLDAALAQSKASFLLMSFTSDWLFPTSDSVVIADSLKRLGRSVKHVELESISGHDAFLLDFDEQIPLVTDFLDSL